MFANESNGSPDDDEDVKKESADGSPEAPKKAGRRKISIEFIEDKSRRHITFSKRKAGIMKKAYELSTLTGTQVLLLVASETGHVYTFATPKLQPLITKPEGKNLIQSCLNAPEATPASPPHQHAPARLAQTPYNDQPMLYPANSESIYPADHAPNSSGYDKDDKEHRIPPRGQQEQGKGFHIDVAQMNSHIGLAYGTPFQNPSSAPMNLMPSHSLSGIGGMGAYPSTLPTQHTRFPIPTQHGSSVGSSTANSGNSSSQHTTQYTPPPFSSSVANMMAQFPSPGFGGPSASYLWSHPPTATNNNSSSAAASHSENASNKSNTTDSTSHHNEENLLPKD